VLRARKLMFVLLCNSQPRVYVDIHNMVISEIPDLIYHLTTATLTELLLADTKIFQVVTTHRPFDNYTETNYPTQCGTLWS
jgi:hypothetical protein